ncbi:head-tail adaptor Ad3 [Ralstonia phage Firinga]|uniref:Adaptor protein 3 n=3 Tax=Firingavirus TaxID=2843381 RepID=A0A7G5B9W3_9CAUD|nr:head-tail adaptor Ad3 [Ralstonia phage RSK1]YP_010078557.1 head-tail adaptor Ad3 [Ralstonia phage Firinga]QMV33086.1 adaptor protein 3 [Ralstonia phage Firinga]QMV33320.1 adaptor protein 3 [Ralstonia phage Hennie]BAO04672.1 putative head DNA stabilization protein [Ralstonia phage RSK1]
MATKGDLVNAAYEEIALAGYVFDLTPEERTGALMRLERLAAGWDARGIRVGYNLLGALATLNDPAGIPDWAEEAFYTNLARRIAAPLGKQLHVDTVRAAADGYRTLCLVIGQSIPQMQMPRHMPIGTGNRRNTKNQQFFAPVDRVTTTRDALLEPSGSQWDDSN